MKYLMSLLTSVLAIAASMNAQVPGLIHYQGRIAVGGVNFTGSGQFKFALVNQDGTTTFWSNDGTSTAGSQPTAAVTLPVASGLYSVLLGDSTVVGMTPVSAAGFGQNDVRLRVWFNDGSHGFQQLSPDQRIAAVGYAMMAANVQDAAITTSKIAPGAVTASQLSPGAAATNLTASGQSAVPSGGIVMSSNADDATLAAAGYVKLGSLAATESDTWTRRPVTYAPLGRTGHCTVWTGTEMVIFGGTNGVTEFNDGGRYSPATNSWTLFSSTINRRAHASAVWNGVDMFVFGGEYAAGGTQYLADVAAYRPGTGQWTGYSVSGTPPAARSRHCATWCGADIMVVWGGRNASNPDGLDTGARFNTNAWSWQSVSATDVPLERHTASCVWTGAEMIVWGGVNNSGYPTKGGRYNPVTDVWTATNNIGAPLGRIGHASVWTGSHLMIWGGMGDSLYGDGKLYDPSTDSWSLTASSNAPSPRQNAAAVWTGTEALVWGGVGSASADPGAGAKYDPVTQVWTPIPTAQQPVARASASSVWSGTEMIVWGGTTPDGLSHLNTGGRYNPTTGSWYAMPIGDPVPIERRYHSTVWTGSEMIIWGGNYNGSTTLGDGARFNPATNTWRRITSLNAPTARQYHSAVWTGAEMLIWGGGFPITNTGGRYNPVTDTWTPITTTNAPAARDQHVAVWTGTEMIVLGGYSQSYDGGRYDPQTDSWGSSIWLPGSVNDGSVAIWTGQEVFVSGFNISALYRPSTNTWQITSTTNRPALRYSPGLVWTGSEVLLWGGTITGNTGVNTGGRYNPSSNTWQPINNAGAPTGRQQHSMVWTGSELLVWGGNASETTSSGARYAPTSDAWTAINSTQSIFRSRHSSVWTGTEMLIWGGEGSGGVLSDVYSYKPGRRLYLYQRP